MTGISVSEQDKTRAEELKEKANKLFAEKHFDEAISFCKFKLIQTLKQSPSIQTHRLIFAIALSLISKRNYTVLLFVMPIAQLPLIRNS